MLKYNNNHIFTGYIKQLLSSFNLPTCKIYTREFARHLEATGKEDLRILKSFDQYQADGETGERKLVKTVRIGYLKNDELFNYYEIKQNNNKTFNCDWRRASNVFYSAENSVKGLTRTLVSPGPSYDAVTHKYLGDYLRFVRDYYNVNLMSMYNCFSDELCSNVNCLINLDSEKDTSEVKASDQTNPGLKHELRVNSLDSTYKLYKIPVKLFANYTIAIENYSDIELFCGLYKSFLDMTPTGAKIIQKTYKRVRSSLFSQPFLYDKLNVKFWQESPDELNTLCWDIAAREQDLYLFIKVPASCKSSIVVLEGDYREYNSAWYAPSRQIVTITSGGETKEILKTTWCYSQNKAILNFSDQIDLNNYEFKPISRLQLLAFNTGESYPFADRLIEYLTGSAITSMDDIHDNIARAQRVMAQNNNFFKIEGLWEEKMQNILYDYMTNSGEIKVSTISVCEDKNDERYGEEVDTSTYTGPTRQKQVLKDTREGYHRQLGHTSKSMMYDILGYVDRDTEKTYASYTKKVDKQGKLIAQVESTIQNVDIYNGLYDI